MPSRAASAATSRPERDSPRLTPADSARAQSHAGGRGSWSRRDAAFLCFPAPLCGSVRPRRTPSSRFCPFCPFRPFCRRRRPGFPPPAQTGKKRESGPFNQSNQQGARGAGLVGAPPLPLAPPLPAAGRGGAGSGAEGKAREGWEGRGACAAGRRGVPAQRRLRGLRGSGNGGLGVGSLRPFLAAFFALIPFGRQIKHTSPSHTAFLGRGLVLLTSMMSSLPCCCPQCVPQPHLIKYLHI